ncbi:MAG TPA: HD domain-containing protein [Roseiflexaceae bacterium]|nr:HD domain-containing protein [Roseiflexaceae bacterium]
MNVNISHIEPILQAIQSAGGRPLIVGGAVRDWLMGNEVKDFDIEVYGISIERLFDLLASFGRVDAVGRSFGILKMRMPYGHELDISLPRRESKVGAGHRGFLAEPDPTMTPREAAARRDFTWNALALTPEGELLDFFGGAADLSAGIIRHTTEAFAEDPLRVLRAMQFAARFDMRLAPETAALSRTLLPEAATLASERLWGEWQKWALKGRKPSAGLRVLAETGWLSLYPELEALIGCPQDPVWHPEGWSISELPIEASFASSAQTTNVDGRAASRSFREFITSTATTPTMISGFGSTADARSVMNRVIDSLSMTGATGTDSFSSSPPLDPTTITNAERLVWTFGTTAVNADKIMRVVFKVPLVNVKTIMLATDNDFEVVRQIVHPVAVYVMNMLPLFQGTTQLQFHDYSVNSDSTILTSPRSVYVPVIIVDTRTAAIDGNIFFYFDLAVKRNYDVAHVFDHTTRLRVFQVTIGDVWTHILHVLDAAAEIAEHAGLIGDERANLLFAALCHDLGKPTTTVTGEDGRIRSPGHAQAGVAPTEALLRRIGCPRAITAPVVLLVREHMAHFGMQVTDRAVRRLALRLAPATITQWGRLVEADHSGRPPLPPRNPAEPIVALAEQIGTATGRPAALLQGRHLIAAGMAPGPALGALLERAYHAQIDGAFASVDEGLEWIARHSTD